MLSRDHDEEKSAERFRFPRRWNQVDESRRGLVLAWVAFTLTFGGARLVTWLIQIDTRDVGDISAGGTHLHHYLWGILLLAGVAMMPRSMAVLRLHSPCKCSQSWR